jgi:GNAT superfamily N-acetyltransferase
MPEAFMLREPWQDGPEQFPAIPDSIESLSPSNLGWQHSRLWGGYPELEWVDMIFAERVLAFLGPIRALFYEQITEFETARLLVRLNTLLSKPGANSWPSVSIGFEFFDSTYRSPDGRLKLPEPDDPFRGKHSVWCMDHGDESQLMFSNSWGQRWGDNGVGYVTREYFDSHVDCVIGRWSGVAGPSPTMLECLADARRRGIGRADELPHCWPASNKFESAQVLLRDRAHTLLHWTVISFDTGQEVDIFELRDSMRVIARAHLFHQGPVSTLREIFVRPELRRRGYGTYMESAALAAARDRVVEAVEVWLSLGDARPRLRPGAEAFGRSLGYSWESVETRRPNIVAIARKEV